MPRVTLLKKLRFHDGVHSADVGKHRHERNYWAVLHLLSRRRYQDPRAARHLWTP